MCKTKQTQKNQSPRGRLGPAPTAPGGARTCERQEERRWRARGVPAMCACGQPDCTLCQRKRSQLTPSGRTTWHIRCSVVPKHIGVVKINTVTLFGKKDSQSSPTAPISVQIPPEEVKLLGKFILPS